MSAAKWSSLMSGLAAVVILVASYHQWVDIRYDGVMRLKRWAKVMLAVCIALTVAGVALALVAS